MSIRHFVLAVAAAASVAFGTFASTPASAACDLVLTCAVPDVGNCTSQYNVCTHKGTCKGSINVCPLSDDCQATTANICPLDNPSSDDRV